MNCLIATGRSSFCVTTSTCAGAASRLLRTCHPPSCSHEALARITGASDGDAQARPDTWGGGLSSALGFRCGSALSSRHALANLTNGVEVTFTP